MRRHQRLAVAILTVAGMINAQVHAEPKPICPLNSRIHDQEVAVRSVPDGATWLRLAILYQEAARYSDAEGAYRKALALLKSNDRTAIATALDQMGTLFIQQGQYSKAEPLQRKALDIRETANDNVGIGISYTHLAMVAFGRHDLALAEAHAEMAASILVPEHPSSTSDAHATPEQQMSALINISLIECARGACDHAISHLNRALNVAHAHYPINSVPVGLIDFLLGDAHRKNGDDRVAANLMLAGITEMEDQLGWGHPTFTAAQREYRQFLAHRGKAASAGESTASIINLKKSPQPVAAVWTAIPLNTSQPR